MIGVEEMVESQVQNNEPVPTAKDLDRYTTLIVIIQPLSTLICSILMTCTTSQVEEIFRIFPRPGIVQQ